MYAPQNLTKCLPLLAAILGDSYGINIVIGNFPTGATDKKTVYIPAMAAATSDWANNLLRFLIDHECAHVRYSDFDVLKGLSPVVNSFRNILEDYRVENRMVSHYPGCRDHFDWGILNFIFGDGPDMTIAPEPLDIHNWVLGYVRSWDVPSLEPKVAAEAAWLENTYAGLMGPLTKLLDEARGMVQSSADCVSYAHRIVNLLDYFIKQEAQDDETETETDPQKLDDDILQKLAEFLQSKEDDLPMDLADQIRAELESESSDDDLTINVSQPAPTQVSLLTNEEISEALRSTTTLRTQLQGLLQSFTMNRRVASSRGRMNYRLLHSAQYNPRIFQRKAGVAGINTSVHLLLDVSGSMQNEIGLVNKIGFAVADVLYDMKGINVGVTAFPGPGLPDTRFTVTPVLRHGEKMHTQFGLHCTGSTPMGEALWWVMQQMITQDEPRKLVIIVTDGDPDNKANTKEAIRVGRSFGFEYFGIGVGNQAGGILTLLPGTSQVILRIEDLGVALFTVLRNSLTGGQAA